MTDELIEDWMLGDARDRLTQEEREMFFRPDRKRHLTPGRSSSSPSSSMPRGSSNASSGACVEGVYDRHTYDAQKAEALQALAGMIFTIVNGVPEEPKEAKPSVWGVVAKKQARTARP